MEQYTAYFEKLCSWGNMAAGIFISCILYWVFPDDAFQSAAMAVLVMMILDVMTKYVALSRIAGGYIEAVRTCTISSEAFFSGTKIKIYTYAVIMIMAGLSYRVTQLDQLGVAFSSVAYCVMWFRELQSILENLRDAGADVGWMIVWSKKKQDQILEVGSEATKEEKDG